MYSARILSNYKIESGLDVSLNNSNHHISTKNLPSKSIENNQYFHVMPDNREFNTILYQKKVKVVPKDFDIMERYFDCQLDEAKEMSEKYAKLMHQAGQNQNMKAQLILEVISGHGINTDNGKYMPFVEVTQSCAKTSTMISSMAGSEVNSTNRTDQVDFLTNSNKTSSKNEGIKDSFRTSFKNEIMLSTRLPTKPTDTGAFEWSKMFRLVIDHQNGDNSYGSILRTEKNNAHNITINLYRTKKSKCKAQKLGQSRSFFTLNFKNQEVNNTVVDFRDNFEAKSQGRVSIRTQYIADQYLLYRDILDAYKHRIELILECSELFQKQKKREMEKRRHNSAISGTNFDDEVHKELSHDAAFYSLLSHNDTILEPETEHSGENGFNSIMQSYEVQSDHL